MRKLVITVIVISILLLPTLFIGSSKTDEPLEVKLADYIDSDLQMMLDERDRLISEESSKPEDLAALQTLKIKIDQALKSIVDNKSEIDRCRAETDQMNADRLQEGYKEEPAPDFPDVTEAPDPFAGRILYGADCGEEPQFPAIYHDLNFDSSGCASFEYVITGSYKADGKAFLTIIDRDFAYEEQGRYDFIYDDVHQIILTEVLDSEKIMIFTYDGTNEGYVDLEACTVNFSKYRS